MAEWDKSQYINENFPLVKEARLHNVWIYEPAGQKGQRWMTPDEFIDEFDKRINLLQKQKSIFLERIKKHYGKA